MIDLFPRVVPILRQGVSWDDFHVVVGVWGYNLRGGRWYYAHAVLSTRASQADIDQAMARLAQEIKQQMEEAAPWTFHPSLPD